MSNILGKKKLYLCFSKFKCLPTLTLSPPPTDEEEENENITAAQLNNPSSLIKNFNSLYDSNSGSISKSLTSSTDNFFSSSDDSDADLVPDFATVFASQRFFFSYPGRSNSIVESTDGPPGPESDTVVNGGIAVQTYSPNPYVDFRKSMQEMVEAREFTDVKNDWDFLHELFVCYLSLNPKHTHKFIVGAFSDLIVTLMSPTANNPHE